MAKKKIKKVTPQTGMAWQVTYEDEMSQLLRFTYIVKWLYVNDRKFPSTEEWRKAFVDMLLEQIIPLKNSKKL